MGAWASREEHILKLTLDTNIVRDCIDPMRSGHNDAQELLLLDKKGDCEIRVVTRIDADIPEGSLLNKLKTLDIYRRPRIGTVGQWDVSIFDAGDFYASDEDAVTYDALLKLIFPNANPKDKKYRSNQCDIGHLVGHLCAGRDIFVTHDNAVLRQSARLIPDFGINVMNARGAVQHVKASKT